MFMFYSFLTSISIRFLVVLGWLATESYSSSLSLPPSVYPVDEYIFQAVVDHFNFRPTVEPTLPIRYYVHDKHWKNANSNNQTEDGSTTGPCFFYAGNEANIFQFINNSGFLFEAAEEFNALVVFAEHRYYGKSNIPDQTRTLQQEQVNTIDHSFLTVEQAMADFNTLNVHIRKKWNMSPSSAFIAFGGSYGGNLAMWLRLKNPNLWAGAIASSATPLKHLLRETNGFARIETEAYGNVSQECPALVRTGWKELYEGAVSKEGRFAVEKALGICHNHRHTNICTNDLGCDLPNDSRFADDIHGWVSGALETMVQYGYPYPTNFYNPIPAYPFKVACEGMLAAGTGLGALRAAASVYYNHTGQAGSCFDFDDVIVVEAARHWKRKGDRSRIHYQEEQRQHTKIQTGQNKREESRRLGELLSQAVQDDADDHAWSYQTCTEVYQPMPTDGISDFEVPYTPNQTSYYADCWKKWGVQPRPYWEEMNFMGRDIGAGSNIFLASGELDPWRAAGIQEKPKGAPDSIIIRIIDNGAHHLDLRAANSMDPPSVVAVRKEQKVAIWQWIADWNEIS